MSQDFDVNFMILLIGWKLDFAFHIFLMLLSSTSATISGPIHCGQMKLLRQDCMIINWGVSISLEEIFFESNVKTEILEYKSHVNFYDWICVNYVHFFINARHVYIYHNCTFITLIYCKFVCTFTKLNGDTICTVYILSYFRWKKADCESNLQGPGLPGRFRDCMIVPLLCVMSHWWKQDIPRWSLPTLRHCISSHVYNIFILQQLFPESSQYFQFWCFHFYFIQNTFTSHDFTFYLMFLLKI